MESFSRRCRYRPCQLSREPVARGWDQQEQPLELLPPFGPPFATWRKHIAQSNIRLLVEGGRTQKGPLYVGRTFFHGRFLPARVDRMNSPGYVACVGYGGVEKSMQHFEVLVLVRGRVEWVEATDGDVPPYAFPVCPAPDGEMMYCARVFHDGANIPGRLLESEGGCVITANGKEKVFKKYGVLSIL